MPVLAPPPASRQAPYTNGQPALPPLIAGKRSGAPNATFVRLLRAAARRSTENRERNSWSVCRGRGSTANCAEPRATTAGDPHRAARPHESREGQRFPGRRDAQTPSLIKPGQAAMVRPPSGNPVCPPSQPARDRLARAHFGLSTTADGSTIVFHRPTDG